MSQVIVDKKLDADDVLDADETGVNRLNPQYAYVSPDAHRGSAPAMDEKARFTSMEAGTAAGNMLCASPNPTQSRPRNPVRLARRS